MSSFKFEAWPTEYRSINQYFGANPQNYSRFGLPGHEGIDVMAPHGSKVFAVAAGRVTRVHTNEGSHNYGVHVKIEHIDGYETTYAHFERAIVRVGQQVKAGEIIGLADNTGNSFGSHLHLTLKKQGAKFENWPYNIIDPTPFLLPLMGFERPNGPYVDGWAYTSGIFIVNDLAQANTGGINLRQTPRINGRLIDLVPGGTIMIVTGAPQGKYTPVQVATAALANGEPAPPPPPAEPPPPTATTVDGWGFATYLTLTGSQGVVGQYGINLRQTPTRSAINLGLVKGGTTVSILGGVSGEYLPVRVAVADFSGPIHEAALPTSMSGPDDWDDDDDSFIAWAFTQNLSIAGTTAVSGRYGTNLRAAPERSGAKVGLFPEGAAAMIAGAAQGEFTPVRLDRTIAQDVPLNLPVIIQPDAPTTAVSVTPVQDTTPGWAFTTQITVDNNIATVGNFGINLRAAPRRNGENIGFIPGSSRIIVTGAPEGEYTPVRVDDKILQQPYTPPTTTHTETSKPIEVNPEPLPMGSARIGLHASADPDITDAEVAEFAAMRPTIIKVLSFHNPEGVKKLAVAHPGASWIVRTFLDFGNRNISPEQFLRDTISDTRRTLNFLHGRDVVIELHNEPNLTMEGLGSTWHDGASFAQWWLKVLQLYKRELPNYRFIYPGLSPGHAVANIKQDHIAFLEASRAAVEASDGLGIHLYWSRFYRMSKSLEVLDDYISRFRFKPIWVTEASNNKDGVTPKTKGRQYLTFWEELQKRPTVQGVTYFVASASNPAFHEEVWVGRGIGHEVGRR